MCAFVETVHENNMSAFSSKMEGAQILTRSVEHADVGGGNPIQKATLDTGPKDIIGIL